MIDTMRTLYVNEIVKFISDTHSFRDDYLFAVNTSDVESGKMLEPPFLPVSELKGQFKKTIENGDILFSEIRPANRHFAIVDVKEPQKYVVSTKLMVLRLFNENVDMNYFYYWLTNSDFLAILQRRAENRICSFPQITFDLLSEYSVPVPSIDEQRKISAILATIDAKIENNTFICSDLEGMAKLLYDYWFVQFDYPDENGKPYKSSGGKMVWNEQLKREIPEGWQVGKVSDLGDIIGGATPPTTNPEYYTDNGIAWATPKDLADSNTIFFSHGERDITKLGLDNCSATIMPKGSVLMTSRAPIGYLAIAENEVCTNQGFKSVIPYDTVGTYYVYYTLQLMMPYIKRYGVGSTFAEVSKQDLDGINVIIPDKRVCTDFNSILNDSFERICLLEQENRHLVNLRDFLLPMLMNGQVKVIIH